MEAGKARLAEEQGGDALAIRIRGQVQGVGFRPFVWRIARAHGVRGHVANDAEGVLVHAEGGALAAFLEALSSQSPPIAEITTIEVRHVPSTGAEDFRIVESAGGAAETRITPDLATCPECIEEVLSEGRRKGYPFTNCTNCGPRFSIIRDVPYDRASTTMAGFTMCAACREEYENPADRRFHAQPIACPDCGPRLSRSLEEVAAVIERGELAAIKGIGGFHLVCDATSEEAVSRLRQRKRRPSKPLALMGPDIATIRRHCEVSPDAAALLMDPSAPIVLLPLRTDRDAMPLPENIAPGLDHVGWMLPMTPLHHLLAKLLRRPLVMTSGNVSGRPQVIDGAAAKAELGAVVELVLDHDRPIARRLDDSVTVLAAGRPRILRRARGHVPRPLVLPDFGAPPVLALGGDLKAVFCLLSGREAVLSPHLGDLDDPASLAAWREAIEDHLSLFDHVPRVVAVDVHPAYRSALHGRALAEEEGLVLVEVAHHHAHMASVMAENGLSSEAEVAAVVLDGIGLDAGGTIRGGEVLVGGYGAARYAARLVPAPLPGGDAAAREPWRNLLARLDRAGFAADAVRLLAGRPLEPLRKAVSAGVNAPLSSSAGRLFDAVAAGIGIAPARIGYEGEAAMRLEALARRGRPGRPWPFALRPATDPEAEGADRLIDDAPMWEAFLADLAAGADPADMARSFHEGLANAFAAAARETGCDSFALSGGVMANSLLLECLIEALGPERTFTHSAVPPGDGGLALGQAAVAACRLR